MNLYKINSEGYRVSKRGTTLRTIEKEAIQESMYLGQLIKENGTYYYFNRKQGNIYVYLP